MRSAHPDIKVEFGPATGSPGLVDITAYVVSDQIPLVAKAVTEELTPYGTTATVNEAVGLVDPPDLDLDLKFLDDDNGPIDLMGAISDSDTPDYKLRVTLTKGSPATYSEWLCAIVASGPVTKRRGVTRWKTTLTSRGPINHYRQGVLVV